MQRCACWVQSAQVAEVAEAGTVAGGQDDRIDPLPLVVVPDDLIAGVLVWISTPSAAA